MLKELAISFILIILAVLVLNPMDFWMPDMVAAAAAGGLFIIFIVFTAFVWRESSSDEREAAHVALAGRFGYLAGVFGLTVGVIAQTFKHAVDPWMVGALVLMVLAKLAARVWSSARN